MCKYIYHHYPSCGHIASFTIDSCCFFLNALRSNTWEGADLRTCTNVREHHDLLNSRSPVYCLKCENTWHERILKDGIEATLHGPSPTHVPIEGLNLPGPILTTQMAMNLNQGNGPDRTFLLDDSTTSPSTAKPKTRPVPIHIPPPASDVSSSTTSFVDIHSPKNGEMSRRDTEFNDLHIIDTDMISPQTTCFPTTKSKARGNRDNHDFEDDDEEEFHAIYASDTDYASDEDFSTFVKRKLDNFMFPTYGTQPSPDLSPRSVPQPSSSTTNYVSFPSLDNAEGKGKGKVAALSETVRNFTTGKLKGLNIMTPKK